jgi:hypothetical protein
MFRNLCRRFTQQPTNKMAESRVSTSYISKAQA